MNIHFIYWLASLAIAIVLCPILPGIINKTKAFFAGRHGAPILQLYWDMLRLAKKKNVLSSTSCGCVRIAPAVSLACMLFCMLFLPLGLANSPVSFSGDIILFLYLLATARFMTVLGALDTGSPFEGMGASREVHFAALAELGTLGVVIFLVLLTKSMSLSGILNSADSSMWTGNGPAMLLAAIAFVIILLCENCRVPFDDPETHLELTMIHEAMILDNASSDLAVIHYGAALKIWIFAAFLTAMIIPAGVLYGILGVFIHTLSVLATAVFIGIIESIMGRCRFLKTPQLLISAFSMTAASILLFIVLN